MNWSDVDKDNIMSKTADFLSKAKTSLEKPKDLPRYKVVVQYETEFKQHYVEGLTAALKHTIKQYKTQLSNDSITDSDTGTATSN